MARVMGVLILLVIASALGVVTSQHQSRRLVTEIEHEQARTRDLQDEWGRLDIEQQSVAALTTVERLARGTLHMSEPGKDAQVSLDSGREAQR